MTTEANEARRLPRSSSSLGVWWKLGDASPEVEQRLRGIAEEEATVRARMEKRQAAAPAARRKVALTSMSLELVAFFFYMYGSWRARARRRPIAGAIIIGWRKLLLLLPAVPPIFVAAFSGFRKILDMRDRQKLQRLAAERKASLISFRGSYHNLQKLNDDPDAKKLKRTHSRLSFFHVGDE